MKNATKNEPLPEPDPLLTTRQAAQLLSVSPETVIRWILHRGLPATRLPSGRYRVKRSDAVRFLKVVRGEVPADSLPRRAAAPLSAYELEALRRYGFTLPGEG